MLFGSRVVLVPTLDIRFEYRVEVGIVGSALYMLKVLMSKRGRYLAGGGW